MNSLNPNINKLAIKIMEDGPDLSTDTDIANVPKGQPAVERKLETDDIVTVWGPPGTGKHIQWQRLPTVILHRTSLFLLYLTVMYQSMV